MNFEIQYEIEDDGRWIAEIEAIPGVLAYGSNKEEASTKVISLALKVLSERIESENKLTEYSNINFAFAWVTGIV